VGNLAEGSAIYLDQRKKHRQKVTGKKARNRAWLRTTSPTNATLPTVRERPSVLSAPLKTRTILRRNPEKRVEALAKHTWLARPEIRGGMASPNARIGRARRGVDGLGLIDKR
jgi:hypothetical protein